MKVYRLTIDQVNQFVVENSSCQLLSTEYLNNRRMLSFICGCGNPFEASYNKFRDDDKRQCNECGKELNNKTKRLTIEYVRKFVEENSDCVLLSDDGYKNNRTPLKMQCKCGNNFEVGFDNFAYSDKKQCNECGAKLLLESQLLNIDDITKYVEDNTDCKLLSKDYSRARDKLKFQCKCGKNFLRNWNNFKNGQLYCRLCSKGHSKGEHKVKDYLQSNGIAFVQEHTFDGCKHRRKLPFDFYLPDTNTCIEYDGEFHYNSERIIPFHNPILQQKRDAIKTKFCKDNNISLIRIPYYQFNQIDEILKGAL